MRAILECGALRLAAASDPDRLAAAVSVPLAGAALAIEDGDLACAGAMDSAFHEALVTAADNPLLARAYRGIADQIEAMRNRLPKDIERMKRAVVQHRRIIDLALTGRLQEAEAELGTHVQIVQGLTVSMLSEGDRS
jgi:DNA-binding GntR family transcriptional regulator